MTEKLYYADAYQTSFQAEVVAQDVVQGRPAVALDRTAFYPTSGGQPHDLGTLDGVPVLEVQDKNSQVWHLLARPLPGRQVQGVVDWSRRWEHMQNHSGQHILSQAFIRLAEAETIGWHLSENSVTIDLDTPAVDNQVLGQAEALANQVIQEDRSIAARLVDSEELPGLGLRKQPDLEGALRIVEIAGFDQVACSGTHVRSTAQVGLLKILRTERRGAETRVYFACGGRAIADYGRKHLLVRGLATRLTRGEDELLDAVDKLQQEAQSAYRSLRATQAVLADLEAQRLWSNVKGLEPPRLISGLYPGWDSDLVKQVALSVRLRPGCFIALVAGDPGPEDSALLVVTRSDDLDVDAGRALRAAVEAVGGRGGGKPDYAQGKVPSLQAARAVLNALGM